MKKKLVLLIASLGLLMVGVVGGTLAYLLTKTDPMVNEFTPTEVPISVQETLNEGVKSNVTIKNEGNTSAYIRATVLVNWKDNQGNVYGGPAPVAGTDYSITMGVDWSLGDDGFYYYKSIVGAGVSTTNLIDSCTRISAESGYELSVEILAQSIQALGGDGTNSGWDLTK